MKSGTQVHLQEVAEGEVAPTRGTLEVLPAPGVTLLLPGTGPPQVTVVARGGAAIWAVCVLLAGKAHRHGGGEEKREEEESKEGEHGGADSALHCRGAGATG